MIKNARLEKLFVLSHKVTVYIPATMNDENGSHEINNTKYVDDMAQTLAKLFGGATSTDAIGYWVSDARGLEKEKTRMVFAYAANLDDLDIIIDKCEALKNELNQDAIALEIDGQMCFI